MLNVVQLDEENAMPLPLIIKAAALGGAAYAASRWLSTQRREPRSRNDHATAPYPTRPMDDTPDVAERTSIARENHPSESAAGPAASAALLRDAPEAPERG